jgi:hypothetical protein
MSYDDRLREAVTHFWSIRGKQNKKQGSATGVRDAGHRAAVTGGAQLDGFIELLRDIAIDCGLTDAEVYTKDTILPGFYRPTKDWDLVVVNKDQLVAVVEFKSHVGPSFGNNFNNRVEEAIGSSSDILAAFREGAFSPSLKPWLGWLMLLEDVPKSNSAVSTREPHFPVFSEFKGASYAKRYELFCTKLLRDQLYDGTCLILTREEGNGDISINQPNSEIDFTTFITSYKSKVLAHVLK